MATATLTRNVREPKRTVRELKLRELTVGDPERDVRELSIACTDLVILDEVISFEHTDSHEHHVFLPNPCPTATTRLFCEL